MIFLSIISVEEPSGRYPNTSSCNAFLWNGRRVCSQSTRVVCWFTSTGLAGKPLGLRLARLMVNFVGPDATKIARKSPDIIHNAQPRFLAGKNLRTFFYFQHFKGLAPVIFHIFNVFQTTRYAYQWATEFGVVATGKLRVAMNDQAFKTTK